MTVVDVMHARTALPSAGIDRRCRSGWLVEAKEGGLLEF
jgi:hypothetical protein